MIENKEDRNCKLFSKLVSILDEGTIYSVENSELGEIQLRHGNKAKGFAHIICRRFVLTGYDDKRT